MLNNTYITNTEIAKVMFKEYRDQEVDFINAHQAIISKYEKEVPIDKKADKPQPTIQVLPEDKEAMQKELDEFEHPFKISPLTFPLWKKVILDFPETIKGMKWEDMIMMYENIKAKFTS